MFLFEIRNLIKYSDLVLILTTDKQPKDYTILN